MANPDRSVYEPPFDDDLMFDTVDDQETSRGRPLMILLGIVVLLAFAGVVWVAYRQGADHAARNEPPLLAQDPGPTRVAPPEAPASTVPDNPSYDQMAGGPGAADPGTERLSAAPEEPMPITAPPPSTPPASTPPAAMGPTPDMTVAEIPPAGAPATPAPSATIPGEIAGDPPPVSPSVDPLPPGASLPPPSSAVPSVPEFLPPAAEIVPPAPAKPSAAELAAAKAEKDRLAREAAAAKKAEAARIAEEKRQQQLAAATPATETIAEAPPVNAPPSAPAGRGDASGRPTLLTPPSFDLPPPAGAPAATPPTQVAAAAPPATGRSEIVPDETPAAAAAPPPGGAFVVQIGAFNSAEDAAASWKRIQGAYSSALGGAAPEIRQTEINGRTKYRLRATGYADRNSANTACNRLKSAGQQCFIAAR